MIMPTRALVLGVESAITCLKKYEPKEYPIPARARSNHGPQPDGNAAPSFRPGSRLEYYETFSWSTCGCSFVALGTVFFWVWAVAMVLAIWAVRVAQRF